MVAVVEKLAARQSNQESGEKLKLEMHKLGTRMWPVSVTVLMPISMGFVTNTSSHHINSDGLTNTLAVNVLRSSSDKQQRIIPAMQFQRQLQLVVSDTARVPATSESPRKRKAESRAFDGSPNRDVFRAGSTSNPVWLNEKPSDSIHRALETGEVLYLPKIGEPRLHLAQFIDSVLDVRYSLYG